MERRTKFPLPKSIALAVAPPLLAVLALACGSANRDPADSSGNFERNTIDPNSVATPGEMGSLENGLLTPTVVENPKVEPQKAEIGELAPNVSLESVRGEIKSIAEIRDGKPLLLISTWSYKDDPKFDLKSALMVKRILGDRINIAAVYDLTPPTFSLGEIEIFKTNREFEQRYSLLNPDHFLIDKDGILRFEQPDISVEQLLKLCAQLTGDESLSRTELSYQEILDKLTPEARADLFLRSPQARYRLDSFSFQTLDGREETITDYPGSTRLLVFADKYTLPAAADHINNLFSPVLSENTQAWIMGVIESADDYPENYPLINSPYASYKLVRGGEQWTNTYIENLSLLTYAIFDKSGALATGDIINPSDKELVPFMLKQVEAE